MLTLPKRPDFNKLFISSKFVFFFENVSFSKFSKIYIYSKKKKLITQTSSHLTFQ